MASAHMKMLALCALNWSPTQISHATFPIDAHIARRLRCCAAPSVVVATVFTGRPKHVRLPHRLNSPPALCVCKDTTTSAMPMSNV